MEVGAMHFSSLLTQYYQTNSYQFVWKKSTNGQSKPNAAKFNGGRLEGPKLSNAKAGTHETPMLWQNMP